ncbi:MAG: zinc ribbon domain-containing protein [Candidatus Sulfotelmatobacter sp.]|jgi:predicted nucleic acid-binding Zn ribbon protein
MSTNPATPPPPKVLLGCSKCGASLPDEAQFCLKCGKAVSSPPKSPAVAAALPAAKPQQRRPKRRWLLWMLLLVLAGVLVWAVTSDSTGAQEVQEFVGLKQDRPILDSAFSVGPHTFRYYKFALPEGSVNVAVVGAFKSAADSIGAGSRKNSSSDKNGSDKSLGDKNAGEPKSGDDQGIQVYVLTDAAFTVWQNGYATSSLYDSGNVAEGNVQAEIPAGAGIYYLVFSNKAAPKTSKAVHAAVLLRYKSWLPDWFRRMKGRVLDWFGA